MAGSQAGRTRLPKLCASASSPPGGGHGGTVGMSPLTLHQNARAARQLGLPLDTGIGGVVGTRHQPTDLDDLLLLSKNASSSPAIRQALGGLKIRGVFDKEEFDKQALSLLKNIAVRRETQIKFLDRLESSEELALRELQREAKRVAGRREDDNAMSMSMSRTDGDAMLEEINDGLEAAIKASNKSEKNLPGVEEDDETPLSFAAPCVTGLDLQWGERSPILAGQPLTVATMIRSALQRLKTDSKLLLRFQTDVQEQVDANTRAGARSAALAGAARPDFVRFNKELAGVRAPREKPATRVSQQRGIEALQRKYQADCAWFQKVVEAANEVDARGPNPDGGGVAIGSVRAKFMKDKLVGQWMLLIHYTLRTATFCTTAYKLSLAHYRARRYHIAAAVIQLKFWPRVQFKRYRRLLQAVKVLQRFMLRIVIYARICRKRRSVNTVRRYLSTMHTIGHGVNAIRMFMKQVKSAQRVVRNLLARRNIQLSAMVIQWDRVERKVVLAQRSEEFRSLRAKIRDMVPYVRAAMDKEQKKQLRKAASQAQGAPRLHGDPRDGGKSKSLRHGDQNKLNTDGRFEATDNVEGLKVLALMNAHEMSDRELKQAAEERGTFIFSPLRWVPMLVKRRVLHEELVRLLRARHEALDIHNQALARIQAETLQWQNRKLMLEQMTGLKSAEQPPEPPAPPQWSILIPEDRMQQLVQKGVEIHSQASLVDQTSRLAAQASNEAGRIGAHWFGLGASKSGSPLKRAPGTPSSPSVTSPTKPGPKKGRKA